MTKAYPDYPPPSFLEATSVPVSSGNATFAALSQSVSLTEPNSTLPMTSPTQPLMYPPSSALSSAHEVDSDTSSLEIIDIDSLPVEGQLPSGPKLEENIRRDWLNRRGIEFPSPPQNQARGSLTNRSRALLDSDSEDETPYAFHQTGLKNKNLSPLRTLFPYRGMSVDPPLSASPNSSPYSSRSSLSFLSATSLKMSMSTTSISSVKGEGFFSRKFLTLKGKDRAKESLDAWEVVEKQPDPSLTSDNLSSPTRSQSFTYGMSVSTHVAKEQAPPVSPPPNVTTSAIAPHPLSLRDRKPPPVPFVTRPKKKAPNPPSKPAPLVPVPQGPILVSVRTRIPPSKKPAHLTSSPLVHDSWCPASLEVDAESNSVLRRAIVTPLPVSPIESGSPTTPVLPSPMESISVSACAPSSTFPTMLDHQTPVWENNVVAQDMSFDLRLSPRPALPSLAESISVSIPVPGPSSTPGCNHHILMREGNSIAADTPDSFHMPGDYPDDDESRSPVLTDCPSALRDSSPALRRHYPGRPLPQPPGTPRSLSDGTDTHDEPRIQPASHCPEGLLIDLDDSSSVTGTSTPLINSRENNLAMPATSSSSSVDLLGSIADMETPAIAQHTRSQVNTSLAFPVQASSQLPLFSEVTDFDVLVSQISEEEHRDGSNYDALLILSEFIGPASPSQSIAHSVPASGISPRQAPSTAERMPAPNVPLLGNVRLERRRTTKDGRVKLKLGLLDAAVDKCGICLTQFRSGDVAQLGSVCRHAFHEKCLGR
ncbi:hypothetical protein C0989_006274, partial [Termitomyces sp. Mn162]